MNKIKLSEMPEAQELDGLRVLAVNEDNENVTVPLDSLGIPKPQTLSDGSDREYVYSNGNVDSEKCVVSVRNTELRQQSGALVLRVGVWSDASESGKWKTKTVPNATPTAAGAMSAADKTKLDELPTVEELSEQIAAAGGGGIITNLGEVEATAAANYCATKEFVRSDGPRIVVYNVPQNNGRAPVAGLIYSSPYYSNACWQLRLNGKALEWRNITYTESTPRVGGWSKNVFTLEKPVSNGNASLRLKFAPSGETICEAQNFADITALEGKVDAVAGKGLSTHDFNNEWMTKLSNAGVYSRWQANLNKSFNASSNVFSLSKTSTQSDITTALTDYESGKVLTAEDFDYCAANGCMIYNAATQGFVRVTANGGGFYNLIEISFTNYTMLPKMRFVCLRALDDGTWQVMRNGQEERICYYSEYQALEARVAALENK